MSRSDLLKTNILGSQCIGEILIQANLILPAQLQVALVDQQFSEQMLLGEILALRGWINQQTADFFADQWSKIIHSEFRNPLGYYLLTAALLSSDQITAILDEQRKTGLRFGALAVLNGWLQQPTLDFFLESLFPDQTSQSPFYPQVQGQYDASETNCPQK